MPIGHFAINVLECSQTACGITIAIAGENVMAIGLVPRASTVQKLGQAIVSLGETALARSNAIRGLGACWIGRFHAARGQKMAGESITLRPRRCRGQERSVGLESGVVGRRRDQNRRRADSLGVGDGGFKPRGSRRGGPRTRLS